MNEEDKKAPEAAEEQPQQAEEQTTEASAEAEPEAVEAEELSPLELAEEQIGKLKDQLLRQMAEFDNYKKRTLREKTELILNGGEKAITALLPVLDDFERAVADKSDDLEAVRAGVENIFHKLHKTLEGLGVKAIETEGKDFDTDYHEAIAMVPGMGDDKKGKVIDCVQTGYMLNEKVIRHAKVAVGS